MRRGHRNVYGVSAKNDPEHQQAERCMLPLFYAELSGDKTPQRPADIRGMWTDDSDEYKRSRKTEPIFAQISIMEMVRECMGEENIATHEDDVLRAIAQALVSAPGIQRMP